MSPKTKKPKREKLEELELRLDEERKKAETYLNQLKYVKADLENLHKRTQKQIEDSVRRSNSRILMQLLPIVDELGLAVEASKNANKNVLKGVEMVKRKLERLLQSEGVTPIEAVGSSFNPNLHEAILEVETDDFPNGFVTDELRKGYLYREKVLRASMVKVARNPSSKNIEVVEE